MGKKRLQPDYRDLTDNVPITKVVIEVIPHLAQRYETCGDWFRTVDKGKATLHVLASRLESDLDPYNYMAMCVAYHELGEALSCIANGITEQVVDEWDNNFVAKDPDDEPGDDDRCPYGQQHRWATKVEKQLVVAMNFMWSNYAKAIARLWSREKM